MKTYLTRHPLVFSLLITLIMFGLTFLIRAALPSAPVSTVEDLPPELLAAPTQLDLALYALSDPDNLFYMLAALFTAVLITWLGWWGQAGFNSPSRWRNLSLVWFPLLVIVLTFSGGVYISGAGQVFFVLFGALAAAFSQEILFRGLIWRALVPGGVMQTLTTTSLLSGALTLGRGLVSGPWPEALYLTIAAICGSFIYGGLRWRNASIWPIILLHSAFAFAIGISTLGSAGYLLLLISSTLGFVGYGLFLLRNPRVRADGGLTATAK